MQLTVGMHVALNGHGHRVSNASLKSSKLGAPRPIFVRRHFGLLLCWGRLCCGYFMRAIEFPSMCSRSKPSVLNTLNIRLRSAEEEKGDYRLCRNDIVQLLTPANYRKIHNTRGGFMRVAEVMTRNAEVVTSDFL